MELTIVLCCLLFAIVTLTLNISLLVLMLRHTAKSFANFGTVMKFQVVVDIATNVAAVAVMNRTIPIDNSYVFIAHGPCTLLSSSVCFISYVLMTMGASMTIYIILVSFIVRLLIVRSINPPHYVIIALIVMISLPIPILSSVLLLISRSDDYIMTSILHELLPEYSAPNETIFGIKDIRTPAMTISFALLILINLPVYLIILTLRHMILESLQQNGDFLSDKTRRMHALFVKMLDQQCAIPPVVFVVTLVPIQLEYLNLVRHPLVEAMINILARLSTLISPIIVLAHIVPYRKALVRWIKRQDKQSIYPSIHSSLLPDNSLE